MYINNDDDAGNTIHGFVINLLKWSIIIDEFTTSFRIVSINSESVLNTNKRQ